MDDDDDDYEDDDDDNDGFDPAYVPEEEETDGDVEKVIEVLSLALSHHQFGQTVLTKNPTSDAF